MRSTKQFLESKFTVDQQRHHHKRSQDINAQRSARQLPEMAYPDEFLDSITCTLMHRPMDISIADDEKVIVDYESLVMYRASKNGHPLNRQPMKPITDSEPYSEDTELAARINAHLTIEELREFVAKCEALRQEQLLEELDGKSDQEAKLLFALQQAVSFEAIYRAYGHTHEIPAHFLGHAPHAALMTLPVILDGQYHIDFFELLKTLPDNHVRTKKELQLLEEQAAKYRQDQVASFEIECAAKIEALPAISETYTEENRAIDINVIRLMHQHKAGSMQKLPIQIIFPLEPQEYCNPFTNEPIKSIAVNYDLLAEIDMFLDPFEVQMVPVQHLVSKYNADTASMLKDAKSYADLLTAEKFPADKIPESMQLGRIIGDNSHLEIMTHPVLLDGQYLIDLQRLEDFWAPVRGWFSSSPSRRGINPFTGNPIKTITYHQALKDATDRFILNREAFKKTMTQKEVQNGSYLRKDTCQPKLRYMNLDNLASHRPRFFGAAAFALDALTTQTEKKSEQDKNPDIVEKKI